MAFCKINKIPYEGREIRVSKLQQRGEEYVKINPAK
jgi:hypothetical protein